MLYGGLQLRDTDSIQANTSSQVFMRNDTHASTAAVSFPPETALPHPRTIRGKGAGAETRGGCAQSTFLSRSPTLLKSNQVL